MIAAAFLSSSLLTSFFITPLLLLDANPGQDTTEQFQEINRAYHHITNTYGEYGSATRPHSTPGSPFSTSNGRDHRQGSDFNPFGGRGGFGQEADLGDKGFDSYFRARTARTNRGPADSPFNGRDFRHKSDFDHYDNGFDDFFRPGGGRGANGRGTASASSSADSPFNGGDYRHESDSDVGFEDFYRPGNSRNAGARERARTSRAPPPPPPPGPVIVGEDLRFDLEIDFKTAAFGGEEKVRMRHKVTCDACTGHGVKPVSPPRPCASCGGSGSTIEVTRTPFGEIKTQQECQACHGSGQKKEYCVSCDGKGEKTKSKQLMVTIPPGVEDGHHLCVRGEGDPGPNGGPSGDLFIFLKVKEDPKFRREGEDIYSEATISFVDAILGASVKTPGVDGKNVTVKVPPSTQPGQVLRLRGNGAPKRGNSSSRGDHYVTINVEIPKDMIKEDEELIEKLRSQQEKRKWDSFSP